MQHTQCATCIHHNHFPLLLPLTVELSLPVLCVALTRASPLLALRLLPPHPTRSGFNSEKGFGFIAPAAGGDDLFVHQSAIHSPGFRSLMEGEEVEYKAVDEGGKMKAVEVTGPKGDFVQGVPRRDFRGY